MAGGTDAVVALSIESLRVVFALCSMRPLFSLLLLYGTAELGLPPEATVKEEEETDGDHHPLSVL